MMPTPSSIAATEQQLFILSPARSGGRRGQIVLDRRAAFPLAVRLRGEGVPVGELFSFLSGLYFRGKLAYAQAFARTAGAPHGVLVIVPGLGLVPPETNITVRTLRSIGRIGVTPGKASFQRPFARAVRSLAGALGQDDRVVLLGSIATGKYVDVMQRPFGERLRFPAEFVGRGDMSRGGLLLRCVRAERELDYVPVAGSTRIGRRPPRLEPAER
jgi:hypothetical protein